MSVFQIDVGRTMDDKQGRLGRLTFEDYVLKAVYKIKEWRQWQKNLNRPQPLHNATACKKVITVFQIQIFPDARPVKTCQPQHQIDE